MRRSDGLPWTVLAEEAAVMEPAVGLGCILGSAQEVGWEEEEEKEKQQHNIRASKYTSSIVVAQQDSVPQATPKRKRSREEEEEEEEEEHIGHVSCFWKGHSPPLDKMTFKEIYNWI